MSNEQLKADVLEAASCVANHNPVVFQGHINTIRNGIAYITLMDEKGLQSFAECDLADLKKDGITDKFEVLIYPGTRVVLRAKKQQRELSKAEWKYLSETIDRDLADYSVGDDY